MLDKLFVGKDTKALMRALELTKQKAEIEKELSTLRDAFAEKLEHAPDKCIKLEELGMAVLQQTERTVLDTDLLVKMIQADPKLLEVFVKEMVNVKQTSLEKYVGSPVYNTLIKNVIKSSTVRFIAK